MAEARSAMHSHDVDATIEGINNVIDGLSALEEEYQRGGAGSAQYYVVLVCYLEALPRYSSTYTPSAPPPALPDALVCRMTGMTEASREGWLQRPASLLVMTTGRRGWSNLA